MTVEKLIKRLEKHNKDAKVKLHTKDGEEVLFVVSLIGDEKNVYLECESDNDMSEEIRARMQYAVENNLDELDFYMEMLEDGIDVEMVRRFVGDEAADHMQEFCEEHGLLDDKTEVIYDEGWDAYVCPNCGAYIIDRNTAKYTDYIPPKNCSQCGCEIKI